MSVNFNVRRVNDTLLLALRRDDSLTTPLCDRDIDFEPDNYEREFLAAVPPERQASQRAHFERLRQRILDRQRELFSLLEEAGLARTDAGPALHLERAHWGMESMIHSPLGGRIVAESAGEAIGDDVGYGPARLLSPHELATIVTELARVTRDAAEPRFRAYETAEYTKRRAGGLDVPKPVTDEEFEEWSWRPFCALRDFARKAAEERASLLKWYD